MVLAVAAISWRNRSVIAIRQRYQGRKPDPSP
jgi:hypothetical protein